MRPYNVGLTVDLGRPRSMMSADVDWALRSTDVNENSRHKMEMTLNAKFIINPRGIFCDRSPVLLMRQRAERDDTKQSFFERSAPSSVKLPSINICLGLA